MSVSVVGKVSAAKGEDTACYGLQSNLSSIEKGGYFVSWYCTRVVPAATGEQEIHR